MGTAESSQTLNTSSNSLSQLAAGSTQGSNISLPVRSAAGSTQGLRRQLTLNLRKMLISDKISKDNLKESLLYPVLKSETFLEKI